MVLLCLPYRTFLFKCSLGRFLRRLRLHYIVCNVEEVLDMVEARKKTVDELLEHGCTWRFT